MEKNLKKNIHTHTHTNTHTHNEKAGLKLNIQKTKIMASGSITSWQTDGEKNGNSDRLYFLGLQKSLQRVTTAMNKRHLLLGRKVMINLDGILKNRNITLLTKGCIVKAMDFLVVIYGCESWTIKKAEHRRTDAFELRCWRRLDSP